MKHKYVSFISDAHLIHCISNLHNAYLKAKNNITKSSFYSNKVDTIKLTFDSKFNGIDEESLIQAEIMRQIDKSINNSIGTFHEEILGGIKGFELGNLSGFDIKAKDDSLFALFKLTEMPSKIEECVFDKLAKQANLYKNSICYLVDFSSEESYTEKFIIGSEELSISHKRVYKISLDKFYDVLSHQENALKQLINVIPLALEQINTSEFAL